MSTPSLQEKPPTFISQQISTTPDDRTVASIRNDPFSNQFLDRDEASRKARNTYIKILIQRTCLIVVAMFAIFPIYWGALWKIPARSLEGWIVVGSFTSFFFFIA